MLCSKGIADFDFILGRAASNLIDEMLILEVKVLMQLNDLSISEIAYETGFEDVSYCGCFFKKHTSYTPTEYRKMIEAPLQRLVILTERD